jgi:hypothetical protein
MFFPIARQNSFSGTTGDTVTVILQAGQMAFIRTSPRAYHGIECGNTMGEFLLSPSRFSTYQTQHYAQTRRFNTLLANQTDRPKLRSKLFGLFTLVRVVLYGLRRSPIANRRLGGEAARSGGICHLLGEYTVARPSRSQS